MKKKIALVLSALLTVGLIAGCGNFAAGGRNVSKYVTLGAYKGVEVTVAEIPLDEADVEAYSLRLYQNGVTAENGAVTDRPVELGDTANIDYVGKKDGVAFEGGTDSGYNLGIGSGTFIEGFEDGLVGVKPGETVDLQLTFPENYQATDLAGQKVVFTVTVNYILPNAEEMVDGVVAGFQNEAYSNLEELKKYANDYVVAYNQEQYETNVDNAVFEAVMNNAVFKKVPEEDVKKYKEIIHSNLQIYASYYGMDVETLALYFYGKDVAALAEEYAKQSLVFQAIANAEKLNISDKELEETLNADAKAAGYTVEEYLGGATEEDYRESLMIEKVLDFVTKNAVVKSE